MRVARVGRGLRQSGKRLRGRPPRQSSTKLTWPCIRSSTTGSLGQRDARAQRGGAFVAWPFDRFVIPPPLHASGSRRLGAHQSIRAALLL